MDEHMEHEAENIDVEEEPVPKKKPKAASNGKKT